jgi:hypothetical protein
MQAMLEGYDTRLPHQGSGMNGTTPIRVFTEGLPKGTTKEVTEPAKSTKFKAA